MRPPQQRLQLLLLTLSFCYSPHHTPTPNIKVGSMSTALSQKREQRILRMVVVMVICGFSCWMPYSVVALLPPSGSSPLSSPHQPHHLYLHEQAGGCRGLWECPCVLAVSVPMTYSARTLYIIGTTEMQYVGLSPATTAKHQLKECLLEQSSHIPVQYFPMGIWNSRHTEAVLIIKKQNIHKAEKFPNDWCVNLE